VYNAFPEPLRASLQWAIGKLPVQYRYQSWEWKLKRFTQRFDTDRKRRHFRWMSNTDLPDLERLLPQNAIPPILVRDLNALPVDDVRNQLLALDFQTYLPGSVLTKVDRMAMHHGLEVRPPFLDQDLVNWSFSVPFEYKLRGRTSKYLLKRVAEEFLPTEIVHRKKKGFAIPLAKWLRGSLRTRLEASLADSPVFEKWGLRRAPLVEWNRRHQSGQEDRSRTLWAFLVLDHWAKRHL
jgi:asparagine synthase (glutamine-hydrolysing)